jgi:hypothetical protein
MLTPATVMLPRVTVLLTPATGGLRRSADSLIR